MIWDGSKFVAVGDHLITIGSGAPWSNYVEKNALLNSVAVNPEGQYVAVGEQGNVYTSNNGSDWALQNGDISDSLTHVIWGDNRFVTIAKNTGSLFARNELDQQWSDTNTLTANHQLNNVAWNGNYFVAVGDHGTIIYSMTGRANDWQSVLNKDGVSQNLKAIAWNGQEFVVVGDRSVFLNSPDGETWHKASTGTTETLNDVIWANQQFVVVGNDGVVMTSIDGQRWSSLSHRPKSSIQSLAWSPDYGFVAVTDNGSVLTSADATDWSEVKLSENMGSLEKIIWNGNAFYAVTGNDGKVYMSKNGLNNWSVVVDVNNNKLTNLVWSDAGLIVIGQDKAFNIDVTKHTYLPIEFTGYMGGINAIT